MCENLKAEKSLMKESEVRLMQENKSLLEHQKSQNVLVTNLQTLQVSTDYISNINIRKSTKQTSFLCRNFLRYSTMQFHGMKCYTTLSLLILPWWGFSVTIQWAIPLMTLVRRESWWLCLS